MSIKRIIICILLISISIFSFAEDTIVYITKTGTKYHLEGCASLRGAGIPVELSEALSRGYEPCKRCSPPPAESPENADVFEHQAYGLEELALPFCSETSAVVKHEGYSFYYNEEHEQAEWVAYLLTFYEVNGEIERSDNFKTDPFVTTGSAELEDYRGSGYDRGHLAPAADMKWSEEAMNESFYMSNMSPQEPGFNRGIWKELETWVREQAEKNYEIYIVTGPVLTGGPFKKIGDNNVSVPAYFYKVVLDYYGPAKKAIGFILPNRKSERDLSAYSVPVDVVEERTGLDFFHLLSDDIEDSLESEADFSRW